MDDCKGWFHCDDCCGPCPECGKEGEEYWADLDKEEDDGE